jgi:HK97 family phage portal protein
MGLLNRIKNAINVFMGADPPGADIVSYLPIGASYGGSSYYRPDRPYLSHRNERSIINSVYNRIAVDVASLEFREILVDSELRYTKDVDSTLSKCLTISGNKDQTGRQLMQDIVISLLDEGCVAVVPVDTDINPIKNDVFDIYSLRTGRILEWYPDAVKIYLYNDRLGKKQEVILPKKMVSIIENPFYSVMNEPNSTLRRLVKTLNLLDTVDEQSANGKLDLIIQLPYTVKSEARQKLADKRRSDIETQLNNSKYGIAYVDSTEHITQLNRSVDNNLTKRAEDLTSMLYNQLNMSTGVLDGTANDATMLNYQNRTIRPIADAIVDEFNRKWISQTAYTQGHRIRYFNDPFKVMSVAQIAESADKLTRNEIMTSNEVRDKIGLKPSMDPNADELRNKNINSSSDTSGSMPVEPTGQEEETGDYGGYNLYNE